MYFLALKNFYCMQQTIGLLLALAFSISMMAQRPFPPYYYQESSPYRTATGVPGEKYWQNQADYLLEVQLDTENHRLTGTAKITYINNSPQALSYLWLHIDQNAFRSDSRAQAITPPDEERHHSSATDGMEIGTVKANGKTITPIITDTRMQVRLPEALPPNGGKISIEIAYSCTLPTYGADRTGRYQTDSDEWVYAIAQWYPRVAVLDDRNGWNVQPYLGAGEFYSEFGEFEYKITVPQISYGNGVWVWLMNAEEVLPKKLLDRLETARGSNETVMIIDKDEVGQEKDHPAKRQMDH